jgi:hypothetical protein
MTPTIDGRTPHDEPGHLTGPAPVAQWVGMFLAPVVFLLHLQGNYLLVLWACGRPMGALLVHLASALAVLLAAAGCWTAWVTWERAGGEEPGEGPGPVPRTRLLAASGMGFSAVVTLILLAQLVAGFFISPCQ